MPNATHTLRTLAGSRVLLGELLDEALDIPPSVEFDADVVEAFGASGRCKEFGDAGDVLIAAGAGPCIDLCEGIGIPSRFFETVAGLEHVHEQAIGQGLVLFGSRPPHMLKQGVCTSFWVDEDFSGFIDS